MAAKRKVKKKPKPKKTPAKKKPMEERVLENEKRVLEREKRNLEQRCTEQQRTIEDLRQEDQLKRALLLDCRDRMDMLDEKLFRMVANFNRDRAVLASIRGKIHVD